MLISERKLRKIIRQEILREHQELLVEFNLKKIVEKAPKVIPALILMLSAGAMSACDDIKSADPAELSAEKASIALGLESDPSLEISYDSADTVDGLKRISDEGKKACKDGIKYLEQNNVENPELVDQLKRSIAILNSADGQLDNGFVPKNPQAAERLVGKVNDNAESICQNLNYFIQGGYFK